MLEPLSPEEAVTDFLEDQKGDVAVSSVENYKYSLNPFVEWSHDTGLDNLNDLTGRKVREYKRWRWDSVGTTTLRNDLWTFKKFITYCATLEAVPRGMEMKVKSLIPAKDGSDVREVWIQPEHARRTLAYLEKAEYGSLRHIAFMILWRTGIRVGSLNSLDREDFIHDPEGNFQYLHLRHRPDTGTPLKNKHKGERAVPLTPDDAEAIAFYLEHNHPGNIDKHGRDPLLMGDTARIHKTTLQRNTYTATKPCHVGQPCPHDKDPDTCEHNQYNTASGCPSSVSPHAVRKGRMIDLIAREKSIEDISDMVNSRYDTIKEYYDLRHEGDKANRLGDSLLGDD